VQHLPYDDPGRPDVRSPARYLLWTGARQWRTLVLGMLFGVVWMVAQALVPAAIGRGLDAGVATQDLGAALEWSLVVLGLALVQAVAGVMRHRTAVDNWLRASFRAMQLLGRHSARVGVAVRRKLPTGEVVSAATNDALYVGGVFDVSARFAGSVVSSVVVAALVLRTSTLLGVVVLVGVPLMVLTMGPVMRPLHGRQQVQREVAGRLTALGADTVAGLRVLRGVGGEAAFFARYRRRSDELRDAGVRVSGLQASLDAAQVLLPGVFLVVFTWLGARLALRGDLSAGDIVAFYGYAFFLVVPIRTAVETADRLTRSLVGARRIIAVLRTEPEVADADPAVRTDLPPAGASLVEPGSGLVVEPGRMLGLVSADPDSTAAIAHRLGRLTPDTETVLGGVPLSRLPVAAVRERVTVSEAEPRLFTGRLRDELDLRDRSDDAALLGALHVAAAEDVLDALPDGLDSPVEEGGRGFSGGQRQRLALARVLLTDAEVLVLVEPTSAVDAHTEALVARRLHDWRHGPDGPADGRPRSTVVTSTSPLLLDRCDEVAFVVDGRVTARGRHRDLLRDDPAYRDTVTRGEQL
jgi:ABC-type multidrug transport system fused ATPase/permease subunit